MVDANGFVLEYEQVIPELNTLARYYRHIRTSAQLLSLINEDQNKVFGITFRTPPSDSTGIAHIMEHSVLCGSEKYPLKEPFIELVKGSLKTFVNAMTYPDKTCYPVASQNVKDFYNLVDVYMDAVFHPLIPPTTLQQEGWHFELEHPDDPIKLKGVVFNEMKGAYSNPDDVLMDSVRISLFPDTPYGVDSGGDPRHIPDLSYAQFKSFHEKFYHPTNARIFFYGDDDPEERLRRMDAYLEGYERIDVDSSIPIQTRFDQPRLIEKSFDPGDEAGSAKGMLVMNWLFSDANSVDVSLALSILAHILIGTPASPLQKALIDSDLGEDLAGVGLELELLQPYFSTGLKGVQTDADGNLVENAKIKALIFGTLEALARDGIDPEMIAAALNTVEFRLRENNTGSFPQGLLLMLRSLTSWLYDKNPIEPLAFGAPLSKIKTEAAADNRYFEKMIQKFFLDNSHCTTLILKPEPGIQRVRDEEEKNYLAKRKAQMSQAELDLIMDQTRKLKALQEQPDPPDVLAMLPGLKLEDLEKEIKRVPIQIDRSDGCEILYHNIFSNGILYLDLGFDLHTLPQDLLPYVNLFGRALLEMGTEREDFVRLSQRIGRATGGIWSDVFTSMIRDKDKGAARLFLRSKATMVQAQDLLDILLDILLTARLDQQDRFRQIVLEEKASAESVLVPAGHQIVNSRLRAMFNEADWANEKMSGISQLFFLRSLVKEIEKDWTAVQQRLEELRRIILKRSAMIVNVTLDHENWTVLQPVLKDFLSKLPLGTFTFENWAPEIGDQFEGLAIPAQVNYVGKGADLYKLGYPLDGSIDVITNYLRTTWLWERLRVLGGAYGGFCIFNSRSGVFTYISYRDPNLLETLDNYDQTEEFLRNLDLDQDELIKSIIGAIGGMDAYQLPDARGYSSMLWHLVGDTDETRQRWRDQILSTTPSDFRTFADYLRGLNATGYVVVMGSQDAIAEANRERGDWLKLKKVL